MHPKGKNTPVDRVLVGWPIWPAYVCFFWKSITFLERYIAKFFFAHKLFIYWSLHKKIPSPWIIFAWELCARKVFFGKKVVVFWKFVIFEATYNLQTPMEWPLNHFFLESLHFSLSGIVLVLPGSGLDQFLLNFPQTTQRLANLASLIRTREG